MGNFFLDYARKATVSSVATFLIAAGGSYGAQIGTGCAEQIGGLGASLIFGGVAGIGAWFSTFFPKNKA